MCVCRTGFIGNGFGPSGCVATSFDPCVALKCKNGGVCVSNGTVPYCRCPRGTVGELCDRVNPCDSNPCWNGGNCTSSRYGLRYTCACLQGFTGSNCQNQARRCGGLKSSLNGTIRYPEEPNGSYNHNSRCAWLIKTNHTKVLNVTFTKFDVERSADCKYDWLQVKIELI